VSNWYDRARDVRVISTFKVGASHDPIIVVERDTQAVFLACDFKGTFYGYLNDMSRKSMEVLSQEGFDLR